MSEFTPKIIAFVCNWCSYAGADKAGGQKLHYPSTVKLIRVMCSGRVDPSHVMQAFYKGADGVMVLGCHPGDCHYRDGNLNALRRFRLFEVMLEQFGIQRQRFVLDWVAASESKKFQEVTTQMHNTVLALGALHIRGNVQKEQSYAW